MKKMAFAAVALTMGATPAMAQEISPLAGFKVMGIAGVDSVDYENIGTSDTAVLYGAAVNYDADLGSVILGGEAEITDSGNSERADNVFIPGDSFELRADRDLYVGARVGIPLTIDRDSMFYVKGGYTNARLEAEYNDGVNTTEDGENLDGYRVGVGFELLAAQKIPLRLEYRYSDYGELGNTGVDYSRHQFVAGIGYKF